jgi:hypothetical protein
MVISLCCHLVGGQVRFPDRPVSLSISFLIEDRLLKIDFSRYNSQERHKKMQGRKEWYASTFVGYLL